MLNSKYTPNAVNVAGTGSHGIANYHAVQDGQQVSAGAIVNVFAYNYAYWEYNE